MKNDKINNYYLEIISQINEDKDSIEKPLTFVNILDIKYSITYSLQSNNLWILFINDNNLTIKLISFLKSNWKINQINNKLVIAIE